MSGPSSAASLPLYRSPVLASYPPQPALSPLERLASKSSAKGKERAWNDGTDEETELPRGMSFGIRFTEGEEDLEELWVGERETVREVKRRIRFLRPGLSPDGRPRRLRLIQLGRLLTDGVALVPYTIQLLSRRAKLVEQQQSLVESSEAFIESLEAVGREIGVSVREKPEKDVKGKGKQKGKDVVVDEDERVWLHCSVGEAMEDDEIEGERVQTSQITPLQGFDKLRDAGFSEQEIATMREEFRANAGHAPIDGDEDEHARALEDQWMEGLTGQNEATSETSTAGVYSTLLQGVCVGFFVPFLPFFFFRTSIFSKRMQMAIVLGFVVNLIFGLLRTFS